MLLQYLIGILIILLLFVRWKTKKYMKIHKQLGNDLNSIPVIGNAMHFLGNSEELMKKLTELSSQTYKRKHRAVSISVGINFFVIIADLGQACTVLKSTLHKNFANGFLNHIVGNGTSFAPVDIWHQRRKILRSVFEPRFIRNFVQIFEDQSKIAADLLETKVGKGNFSCFNSHYAYSLDSIHETLFGVNMDTQRRPDHPFLNAYMSIFQIVAERLRRPWLHTNVVYKLLPVYKKLCQIRTIVYEFVDNIIDNKVTTIEEQYTNQEEDKLKSTDQSKRDFKTLVELMRDHSGDNDKVYNNEELREEALALGLAGTDTTTVALSFAILLLSQHQDVQDKVYSEIQEVLGDSDEPLQLEDLIKFKYTKAVIKETLRLYPPAPFIARYCDKDLEIAPGLVLPEGCNTVVSIWGIQRNPEYWGEDADDFRPDRFMTEIPMLNAFMAFSYGARNCVGQQYAMLLMTTYLVTMLRRFRFTPSTNFSYDEDNPLRLSFDILINHVHDFSIQVERRVK